MMKEQPKFKAWDWDDGKFKYLPSNDIVEAIYTAWNYEFSVYDVESEDCIFNGQWDNEENNESLESYGIRVINDGGYRKLQTIETGEIHEASWA